jgi:hypothetical protein
MNTTKRLLELSPRPVLRLSEIDRLIKRHRILVPAPSRPKLIALCTTGVFETVGDEPTTMGWLVFEDSFLRWVASLRE